MSELAERFEVLVETFARKIAALSIDAAEQKGRADRAEAEVERLRREYEPGYKSRDVANADDDTRTYLRMYDGARGERDAARDELAAATKRAEGWKQQACREQDAHAATTAKLATIVAAVEKNFIAEPSEYRDEDGDGVAFGPVTFVCQHCGMHGETATTIDHERTCSYVEIKRALSADGTQAAEAWRELEECYRLFKLVRGHGMPRGVLSELQQACDVALAAVDARRGGG